MFDLYDERATLECDCERVSLIGRKWIAAYWGPKLQSKTVLAFSLIEWPRQPMGFGWITKAIKANRSEQTSAVFLG